MTTNKKRDHAQGGEPEPGDSEQDEAGPVTPPDGEHARSSTDAPLGGSAVTEEQLTAHNEAEEDTLRAIDGDSASG
jgi:hypothetical protein